MFILLKAQNIEKLGADDLKKDVNIYDQTVISASRSEKKIADLPVTIYVITKEQIKQNGYKSLVQALQDIPTVRASVVGNGQEGETFLLRGFRGNYYMKILLNGIPINPTTTLGMPIGEQIPIQQAERIEVIAGAASAIYGADALAGVINIIMQTPEDNTLVQAGVTTGQFGYQNSHFLVGSTLEIGKAKKSSVEYTLWGNLSKQDDLNLPLNSSVWNPQNYNPDFQANIPVYTPNYKGSNSQPTLSNFPRQSYSFGVSMRSKGLLVTLSEMYRREHSSLGQNTASYFFYNPEIFWGERIRQLAVIYQKNIAKFSLTTNISWLNYRLDKQSSFALVFDGGVNGRQYKYAASDDLFFEQLVTFKANKDIEITAGATYQISGNLPKTNDLPAPINPQAYKPFARQIDLSDPILGNFGYNPIVFSNVGAFVQGYYTKNKFTAIAGLRYDYQSIYGDSFNPRLALLYKLTTKTSLRGSFGTAFKAPTTNNSYNSIGIPTNGGQVLYLAVPNPALKPETATNFELASRYQINDKWQLELIAYQNRLQSLIDPRLLAIDTDKYPNAASPNTIVYLNDANAFALVRGLQLSLRATNLTPYKINSQLHISYTQGQEELPNEGGRINTFKEMPEWIVQWRFSISPLKRVWLNFGHYFMSDWYSRDIFKKEDFFKPEKKIKGYYLLNIQATLELSNNISLYGKVHNVFDTEYAGISAYGASDLRYNPQPLRMMQIGANFLFK